MFSLQFNMILERGNVFAAVRYALITAKFYVTMYFTIVTVVARCWHATKRLFCLIMKRSRCAMTLVSEKILLSTHLTISKYVRVCKIIKRALCK